jgi:hypothetical protein
MRVLESRLWPGWARLHTGQINFKAIGVERTATTLKYHYYLKFGVVGSPK